MVTPTTKRGRWGGVIVRNYSEGYHGVSLVVRDGVEFVIKDTRPVLAAGLVVTATEKGTVGLRLKVLCSY